jgi:hypothetical protein
MAIASEGYWTMGAGKMMEHLSSRKWRELLERHIFGVQETE